MIQPSIKQKISEAFEALFDHQLELDSIGLQPTRKEFEGTYTFVVFPYLKTTKKSPEESGKALGEFVQKWERRCSRLQRSEGLPQF